MAKKSSKGGGKPIAKVEVSLKISPKQGEELLETLKDRFERNMSRHESLEWPKIEAKLEAHPEKLSSFHAMESTGGEPDVVGYDQQSGEYAFYDCSEQSPAGRRSTVDRPGGGYFGLSHHTQLESGTQVNRKGVPNADHYRGIRGHSRGR